MRVRSFAQVYAHVSVLMCMHIRPPPSPPPFPLSLSFSPARSVLPLARSLWFSYSPSPSPFLSSTPTHTQAAALETQEDRLRVVDMQRGSVVVDLHILPGASDAKPSQDLAHKLVIMVRVCVVVCASVCACICVRVCAHVCVSVCVTSVFSRDLALSRTPLALCASHSRVFMIHDAAQ